MQKRGRMYPLLASIAAEISGIFRIVDSLLTGVVIPSTYSVTELYARVIKASVVFSLCLWSRNTEGTSAWSI